MKQIIPTIGPIPAVGLGTWRLTGTECTQSIITALEIGYRHIDTADVYNNHEAIGAAIEGFAREELFIVSKIIEENLQPERVAPACERILHELKTPYLDMLLIHWPSKKIPAEQTLAEMVKLKEKGLIQHVGVSNFMLEDLHLIDLNHVPVLANQIELHPYLQEIELVNYCQKHSVIPVAYRPIQRAEVAKEPILQELAEKHGKSPVQITLRWIFQRNIVSIPKATSREHLKENLEIFDFTLSNEDMKKIAKLESGKRYVVW